MNLKDGPYPVRRAAIKQLREAGLLARESVVNGYVPTTEYYNLCRRFVFGLACSTVWRYLPVKHLEYAAAGCAVLTDGAPGLDLLLPPKGYLLYTPETVVSLVREIVEDEGRLRQVVQNARQAQQHVLRYHTDETRSAEICSLLEDRGIL